MKWLILYFLVQLLSGFIMGQVKTPDLGEVEPTEWPGVGGDTNNDVDKRENHARCRERSLPEQEEQIQSEKSESTITIVVDYVVAAVVTLMELLTPLPSGTGRGVTSGSHDMGMEGHWVHWVGSHGNNVNLLLIGLLSVLPGILFGAFVIYTYITEIPDRS